MLIEWIVVLVEIVVGMRRGNHEERRRVAVFINFRSSIDVSNCPVKDVVFLDSLQRNQDLDHHPAIPEKLPESKLRLAKGPELRFRLATSRLRQ